LAVSTGNAAFDPEPLTRADLEAYRERALEEMRSAFTVLQSHLNDLSATDRDRANVLLAHQEHVRMRIEAFAAEEPQGQRIRIHGDYHLGQVLITRNDFVIVDFEGEPDRTLEQRRAKQSPLRDVAGMLRSFSYVEHSALRSVTHNEDEAAKLAPLAHAWAAEVRAAFLSAYDSAARDGLLYGAQPARGLLDLFELEKALYELRYELRNRPSWAGIPLQGIHD
jgi:maltose alpha-D-glucosyltransferase/alpha-amylase